MKKKNTDVASKVYHVYVCVCMYRCMQTQTFICFQGHISVNIRIQASLINHTTYKEKEKKINNTDTRLPAEGNLFPLMQCCLLLLDFLHTLWRNVYNAYLSEEYCQLDATSVRCVCHDSILKTCRKYNFTRTQNQSYI